MKIETTKIFREELELAIKSDIVDNKSKAIVFTYTFNALMMKLGNVQYDSSTDAENMINIMFDLCDIICNELNVEGD